MTESTHRSAAEPGRRPVCGAGAWAFRPLLLTLAAAALAGPWPGLPPWTLLLRVPGVVIAAVLLIRRHGSWAWAVGVAAVLALAVDGLAPRVRTAEHVAGGLTRAVAAVQECLADGVEREDVRRALAPGGAEAEPEAPFQYLQEAARGFPVRLDSLVLLNEWGRPVAWNGRSPRLPLQLRPLGQRAVVAEAGVDEVWLWWREPAFEAGRPVGSVLAGVAWRESGERRVLGVWAGRAAVLRPELEEGGKIVNPAGQEVLGVSVAGAPPVGWSVNGWALPVVVVLALLAGWLPRRSFLGGLIPGGVALAAVFHWLGPPWWLAVSAAALAWAVGRLPDGWWTGAGVALAAGASAWVLPAVLAEAGAQPVPADLTAPPAAVWALAVAGAALFRRLPQVPRRIPPPLAWVAWVPLAAGAVVADPLLMGIGTAGVVLLGRGRRSLVPAGLAAAVLLTGSDGAVARSELVATTEATLARVVRVEGPARALLAGLPAGGLEELLRLPEQARLVVLGRLAGWMEFERTIPGASLALLGPSERALVWGEAPVPGSPAFREIASRPLTADWRLAVLLPPPPYDLLEALSVGGTAGPLALFDRSGAPTARGATFRPMSPALVGRTLAQGRSWGSVEVGERRVTAYLRAWEDGILVVPWMRPPFPELGLSTAGLTLLGVFPLAAWRERRRWRRWWQERRSFSGRVRVLAVVATVLPVVLLAQFLPRQWVLQQERARQELGRAVTRPLVVEPDVADLAWLVRDRGAAVAFYSGGVLEWSNRPDYAVMGRLPTLPPADAYVRAVRGWLEPVVLAGDTLAVFAAFPGQAQPSVIGVTQLTAAGAAAGPSPREWFVITGLFGLWLAVVTAERLGRRVTLPLQRLVGEVQRLERGEPVSTLGTGGDEEVVALGTAFAAMARTVRRREEDLRQERDLLERTLGTLSAAVVVCGRDGRISLANPAARALLGEEECFSLPAERFGGRVEEVVRRGLTGVEVDEVVRPGHRADALWRISAVPLAHSQDRVLVVLEDLSEVARAERLASLAELARIVAHEVKNPLTPIRLWAEELRAALDRGDDVTELARLAAVEILGRVEHLRDVVQGFSNLVALEQWDEDVVDLATEAQSVCEEYSILGQRGIVIEVSGAGAQAMLDRRWFLRALRHLLDNSARALGDGPGRVVIAVEEGSDEARVCVRDTAGGVSGEHLGRLFEPHFSTTAGGTGLGLAVVRRVAERAGGRAEAANGPEGLEVTLHFPPLPRDD